MIESRCLSFLSPTLLSSQRELRRERPSCGPYLLYTSCAWTLSAPRQFYAKHVLIETGKKTKWRHLYGRGSLIKTKNTKWRHYKLFRNKSRIKTNVKLNAAICPTVPPHEAQIAGTNKKRTCGRERIKFTRMPQAGDCLLYTSDAADE